MPTEPKLESRTWKEWLLFQYDDHCLIDRERFDICLAKASC
jgi:hypothetical protein